MIRFLVLQNRQGKTRLSKWYMPLDEDERKKIETEVHRIVTSRDSKFTNFVEYRDFKLVYRRYAGLFFSIGCDPDDSELSYLEAIHLLVELLDAYFGNVCELDLVFHFNKVYMLLDEYFLGGEIMESSKQQIIQKAEEASRVD